jgi:hypothetical protein
LRASCSLSIGCSSSWSRAKEVAEHYRHLPASGLAGFRGRGGADFELTSDGGRRSVTVDAVRRRAAIASSSLRRSPTKDTPRALRSPRSGSAVRQPRSCSRGKPARIVRAPDVATEPRCPPLPCLIPSRASVKHLLPYLDGMRGKAIAAPIEANRSRPSPKENGSLGPWA